MFPKYSEVVKVVALQIVGNYCADNLDNALKAKMHADFTSAINTLIPNHGKVSLEVNSIGIQAVVEIVFEGGGGFAVEVTGIFSTQEVNVYVQ